MTSDSADGAAQGEPSSETQQGLSEVLWQHRIEKFFARVGLVAAACAAAFFVFFGTLFLGGKSEPSASGQAIRLNLVDHQGQRLGDGDFGVEMVLSPTTFYRNRPLQNDGFYRINEHGLRGGPLDPQATCPRVLLLGGSAAFGLSMAEEKTFPSLLAAAHPEVEVANAGTVAYTSEQEVAQLLFELRGLEPELVVDFSGWNDLYNGFWLAQNGIKTSPTSGTNPSFLTLGERLRRMRAVEHSLVAAGQEFLWTVQRRSPLLGWFSRRQKNKASPRQFDLEQAEQVARSFALNMDRLREITSARGAKLLVVLQPEVGQTLDSGNRAHLLANTPDFLPGDGYWTKFPELYLKFRQSALQELAALGIETVDASAVLVQEGIGPGLFLDPVHLNAAGHFRVAGILGEHLTPTHEMPMPEAWGEAKP